MPNSLGHLGTKQNALICKSIPIFHVESVILSFHVKTLAHLEFDGSNTSQKGWEWGNKRQENERYSRKNMLQLMRLIGSRSVT